MHWSPAAGQHLGSHQWTRSWVCAGICIFSCKNHHGVFVSKCWIPRLQNWPEDFPPCPLSCIRGFSKDLSWGCLLLHHLLHPPKARHNCVPTATCFISSAGCDLSAERTRCYLSRVNLICQSTRASQRGAGTAARGSDVAAGQRKRWAMSEKCDTAFHFLCPSVYSKGTSV